MIDSLSKDFDLKRLHKKKIIEIYFFYLRKFLRFEARFEGQFSSSALVIDTFNVKYCSVLTQY